MGSVYRAYDENLKTSVAVKENLFLTDEYSRQFQREGSILAGLRHPCLPRVGDYFTLAGQGQYLIMDYIEGEDLRQRIERVGTLSEREVVLIGAAICDALEYMHTRKSPVVHRDIKPGNIKITPEGEVILVDFGLAKVMQGSQATTTGARAMTPGYSPPEQYGTARTDPRSDVYSLGATLYASLTGIIPEDGLARATGKVQLTSLRSLQPKVSRRLANVIEKALEVEPDDRFQTAEEFKRALLEAGELSNVYPEKLRLNPPPASARSAADDLDDEKMVVPPDPEPPLYGSGVISNHAIRSKPRKRKTLWPVLSVVLFGGALAGLYYLRPDIPNALIARVMTMRIPVAAAANTNVPIAVAPSATRTFTPEKSPTISPTIPTLTVTLTPLPTNTSTPIPTATLVGGGGYGQIAFASDRVGGIMQLFYMNADGSDQTQITSLAGGACQPSWSPDGKQLAFISPCSKNEKSRDVHKGAQIYIMNADKSNMHVLPIPLNPAGDFDPAWSPDGNRLAFTSLRTGASHIYIVDLEKCTDPGTCEIQELAATRYEDKQPAWSPDGTKLAFVRQFLYSQVWLVTADGKVSDQYSYGGSFNDAWPAWSPTGDWLVFSQFDTTPTVPWLIRLAYQDRGSSKGTRILPTGRDISFPVASVSVSPDGNWIVFESWPDGSNHDIYRMDISGNNLGQLTSDPGYDFTPAWRPGTP